MAAREKDEIYYPGQALLALAMAAQEGDDTAINHCRIAFPVYRRRFSKRPKSGSVLWQVEAWSRIALIVPDLPAADFVFELVDWLLPLQVIHKGQELSQGQGQIHGSFRNRPAVATFVYTEAIVRAAYLARLRGEAARHNRYSAAAIAGLKFCSQLVIGDDQWVFLRNPRRAVGGVRESLETFHVRCDHVQHMITLALAVFETELFGDEKFNSPSS